MLPYILGATAVLGLVNRGTAQGRVDTALDTQHQAELAAQQAQLARVPPWEQQQGSILQGFVERGLNIDPSSPAVQEALRRRNLDIAYLKSGHTLQNASWDVQQAQRNVNQYPPSDPLSVLLGIFGPSNDLNPASRIASPTGSTGANWGDPFFGTPE